MDVDKRNEELDETIIQTCKWIQKKLQISDKSIRDEIMYFRAKDVMILLTYKKDTKRQNTHQKQEAT